MAQSLRVSSRHIGVAAEAFAAAQFARFGCDISVQYGANQPEYDLVVVRGDAMLKISVKGSQDGGWGLTQSLIQNADYHAAAQAFCDRHSATTVFCFVQFYGLEDHELPRMYLARPTEIAQQLRETAKGRGDTILYERYTWGPRAHGYGTTDAIPDHWKFTRERVEELLNEPVAVTR